MLRVCKKLSDLKFGQLMAVYEEGNRENGQELYPDLPQPQQMMLAEQEFYSYLRDVFFRTIDACYCLWVVDGRYVSALRLEPYRDGLLLEALETMPDKRGKGYAASLICAVQQFPDLAGRKIYSHVGKRNEISLKTHRSCGFEITSDRAVYIDGSVNDRCYTLCYVCKLAGA